MKVYKSGHWILLGGLFFVMFVVAWRPPNEKFTVVELSEATFDVEPPTNTPTDTPTNTPVIPTNTPTDTPTNTPVIPTNTPTDTPTNTPVIPTNTPTDTPTNTPVTPTNTPTDTPTNTPVIPTNTPTDTPTNTPTNTLTPTPAFEGCTPGFWKQPQHIDSWAATGLSPSQTLESVFDVPDQFGIDNTTLLKALNPVGGKGTTVAARILLRAAVTAVLNAAHPDVDYPRTTADVIADVNAALASLDRATILALAEELDVDNNLGCPFS